MTESEIKAREMKNIEEFRMFDDTFFGAVFDGDNEATQVLIRTILNRDDIFVIESKAQYFISNSYGHEVKLDVLAKDKDGRAFNIEVQRDRAGASPRRARYNSAMVDITLLGKGENYDNLPDRYTFFITEKDYFGRGEAVYHIQNRIEEMGYAPLNDGSFILYVNGEYRNTETPIGELMHDFSCSSQSSIINPVLKKRVQYLKGEEGGHDNMCKLMDDLVRDVVKDAVKDRDLETAKKLIALDKLSLEDIATASDLPLSTVENLASSLERRNVPEVY